MNYRYKVKGYAEKAFILRGMHFRVGGDIETVILESELAFVKERCKLDKVEDLQCHSVSSQPVPVKSQIKPKGAKNEPLQSASRTSKVKNKATV